MDDVAKQTKCITDFDLAQLKAWTEHLGCVLSSHSVELRARPKEIIVHHH